MLIEREPNAASGGELARISQEVTERFYNLSPVSVRSDTLHARVRALRVLVVGEEMKGLVNCNFLPGSARRLELGTVSIVMPTAPSLERDSAPGRRTPGN